MIFQFRKRRLCPQSVSEVVGEGELRTGRNGSGSIAGWAEKRIGYRAGLASCWVVEIIGPSEELSGLAGMYDKQIIPVVGNGPGSAAIRAIIADKQQVVVEGVEAEPIIVAKTPGLQPNLWF